MTLICYGHFIPQIVFPFVFQNKNKQAGTCLCVLLLSINPFIPNANPFNPREHQKIRYMFVCIVAIY